MTDPVDRGRVRAPNPQLSKGGVTIDGVNVLRGTEDPDSITGSSGPDLVMPGGAKPRLGIDVERIDGRGGHDTVILSGQRGDYVASMPEAGDYPNPESKDKPYEGRPMLYGRAIRLENVVTREKYLLDNVERIGFDKDGKPGDHHSEPFNYLKQQNEKGSIEYQTMDQLRAQAENGMSPEEIKKARLASTETAAKSMNEANLSDYKGDQKIALQAAEEKHPDVMNYKPVEPEAPVSGNKMDTMLGITPAARSSSPAP